VKLETRHYYIFYLSLTLFDSPKMYEVFYGCVVAYLCEVSDCFLLSDCFLSSGGFSIKGVGVLEEIFFSCTKIRGNKKVLCVVLSMDISTIPFHKSSLNIIRT
jgi:hypothetical protein